VEQTLLSAAFDFLLATPRTGRARLRVVPQKHTKSPGFSRWGLTAA